MWHLDLEKKTTGIIYSTIDKCHILQQNDQFYIFYTGVFANDENIEQKKCLNFANIVENLRADFSNSTNVAHKKIVKSLPWRRAKNKCNQKKKQHWNKKRFPFRTENNHYASFVHNSFLSPLPKNELGWTQEIYVSQEAP